MIQRTNEGSTHFVNVELDVWSRWPLDAFADALPKSLSRHYVGREGRIYGAHFGPGFPRNVDAGIRRFLRALAGLPRSAERDWTRAHRREFNIGIQAGVRPNAPEFRVEAATIDAVSAAGGTLVITVYAVQQPAANESAGARRPQNNRMQLTKREGGPATRAIVRVALRS